MLKLINFNKYSISRNKRQKEIYIYFREQISKNFLFSSYTENKKYEFYNKHIPAHTHTLKKNKIINR